MAKPIGKTPVFNDEDALVVLEKMKEPPTEKDKELQRKLGIKEQFYSSFTFLLICFINLLNLNI